MGHSVTRHRVVELARQLQGKVGKPQLRTPAHYQVTKQVRPLQEMDNVVAGLQYRLLLLPRQRQLEAVVDHLRPKLREQLHPRAEQLLFVNAQRLLPSRVVPRNVNRRRVDRLPGHKFRELRVRHLVNSPKERHCQ